MMRMVATGAAAPEQSTQSNEGNPHSGSLHSQPPDLQRAHQWTERGIVPTIKPELGLPVGGKRCRTMERLG
jgi:hypothetical protein